MKSILNNKNLLIVLIISGIIASCQSGQKDTDKAATEASKRSSFSKNDSLDSFDDIDEKSALSSSPRDSLDEKNIQDLNPNDQTGTTRSEAVPGNLTKKLQDAIKEKSEQQIMKASGDILAGHPQDIFALNAMAMSHYRQNRMTMAKYFLNKAIKLNSQYAELHSNLGLVLLADNEKRFAIQSFRRALQVNPRDPVASANLGAIYIVAKDYDKAAILLETAYKAGFKDYKTLTNYGISLAAQEKYPQALSMYQAALEQEQQSQETMLNLAVLYIVHLKKMREGQDVLNRLKFVETKPEWRTLIKDLEKRTQVSLE
ncbi:MAG: tetratricopeptide repeat protein [Pseudobdellovibrionaceae bacterium]